MAQAASSISSAGDHAVKTLQAVLASRQAAAQVAEKLGAELIATGNKAVAAQISAAAAFAGVKTAQEAVELHHQFARTALEAYTANAAAVTNAFAEAFQLARKPLEARYAEAWKAFPKI